MCVPLFGPFSLHAMAVVLPAHFVPERPGRPCLDGGAVVELKRTEDTEGSGAVESCREPHILGQLGPMTCDQWDPWWKFPSAWEAGLGLRMSVDHIAPIHTYPRHPSNAL